MFIQIKVNKGKATKRGKLVNIFANVCVAHGPAHEQDHEGMNNELVDEIVHEYM